MKGASLRRQHRQSHQPVAPQGSDAPVSIVFRVHSDALSKAQFIFCPKNFNLANPPPAPGAPVQSTSSYTTTRTNTTTTTTTSTTAASGMGATSLKRPAAAGGAALGSPPAGPSTSATSKKPGASVQGLVEAIIELRPSFATASAPAAASAGSPLATAGGSTITEAGLPHITSMTSLGPGGSYLDLWSVSSFASPSSSSHGRGLDATATTSAAAAPPLHGNGSTGGGVSTLTGGGPLPPLSASGGAAGALASPGALSQSGLPPATAGAPYSPLLHASGGWICRAMAFSEKDATHANGAISVHHSLTSKCSFINEVATGKTMARILSSYDEVQKLYGLSHVELTFEHQYLSRSDMFLLSEALREAILYEGEELHLCGFRFRIRELLQSVTTTTASHPTSAPATSPPRQGGSSVAGSAAGGVDRRLGGGSSGVAPTTTSYRRVGCGLVLPATHINFQSMSPIHYVLVELSHEMWATTIDGRIALTWATKKFLRELLLRQLPKRKASPLIRIIFTGRLRRELQFSTQSDIFHLLEIPREVRGVDIVDEIELHCEALVGRLVAEVRASLRQRLQAEVRRYRASVDTVSGGDGGGAGFAHRASGASLHGSGRGEVGRQSGMTTAELEEYVAHREMAIQETVVPKRLFVYAKHSNTLEALSILIERCNHHYIDRHLNLTGHAVTVVSAGKGLYQVSNSLVQVVCARLHDMGLERVNVVCIGRPPLHVAPLLEYSTEDDTLRSQYHLHSTVLSRHPTAAAGVAGAGAAAVQYYYETPQWMSVYFFHSMLNRTGGETLFELLTKEEWQRQHPIGALLAVARPRAEGGVDHDSAPSEAAVTESPQLLIPGLGLRSYPVSDVALPVEQRWGRGWGGSGGGGGEGRWSGTRGGPRAGAVSDVSPRTGSSAEWIGSPLTPQRPYGVGGTAATTGMTMPSSPLLVRTTTAGSSIFTSPIVPISSAPHRGARAIPTPSNAPEFTSSNKASSWGAGHRSAGLHVVSGEGGLMVPHRSQSLKSYSATASFTAAQLSRSCDSMPNAAKTRSHSPGTMGHSIQSVTSLRSRGSISDGQSLHDHRFASFQGRCTLRSTATATTANHTTAAAAVRSVFPTSSDGGISGGLPHVHLRLEDGQVYRDMTSYRISFLSASWYCLHTGRLNESCSGNGGGLTGLNLASVHIASAGPAATDGGAASATALVPATRRRHVPLPSLLGQRRESEKDIASGWIDKYGDSATNAASASLHSAGDMGEASNPSPDAAENGNTSVSRPWHRQRTMMRCDTVPCGYNIVDSDMRNGYLILELTINSAVLQQCFWSPLLLLDDEYWSYLMGCFSGRDDRLRFDEKENEIDEIGQSDIVGSPCGDRPVDGVGPRQSGNDSGSAAAAYDFQSSFRSVDVFCRSYSGITADGRTLVLPTHSSNVTFQAPEEIVFRFGSKLFTTTVDGGVNAAMHQRRVSSPIHAHLEPNGGAAEDDAASGGSAGDSAEESGRPASVGQPSGGGSFSLTVSDSTAMATGSFLDPQGTREKQRGVAAAEQTATPSAASDGSAGLPTPASATLAPSFAQEDTSNVGRQASLPAVDEIAIFPGSAVTVGYVQLRNSVLFAIKPINPLRPTAEEEQREDGSSLSQSAESVSTATVLRRRWQWRHPDIASEPPALASWTALCTCRLLPLYGSKPAYPRDGFYTVSPHQYTVSGSGAAAGDAKEERQRLLEYVLQRLQQQYQIVVDGPGVALGLQWPRSDPSPNVRLDLTLGHQTHTLKVGETAKTISITRMLHRGMYSNGQVTHMLSYRYLLWNYLSDSFSSREVHMEAQVGERNAYRWEALDRWLQERPDAFIPRGPGLWMRSREVAVVLLPEDPSKPPSFAEFYRFIGYRFSIHFSTHGNVTWKPHEGSLMDTITGTFAATSSSPPPLMEVVLVHDNPLTLDTRNMVDHATGRTTAFDVPMEERYMSVDVSLPQTYHPSCCYFLKVSWLVCAAPMVVDWYGSFIANAARFHFRAVPISCYYCSPKAESLTPHFDVEAETTAEEPALRRILLALLTTPTYQYYPDTPIVSRNCRLVHLSGLCFVVSPPSPTTVAQWYQNTCVRQGSPEQRELLGQFRRAVETARSAVRCGGSPS